MAQCPRLQDVDIDVEYTPDGAVIDVTSSDPARVRQIQRHAHMLEHCIGGESAPQQQQRQQQQQEQPDQP